jgi:two-component sensor histidine kinase/HAMP domain-containing protein
VKIRTQFGVIVALSSAILIVVAASLIIMTWKVDRLQKQKNIAYQVELSARELSYLANDHLLHRENQQRDRWEAKFASFSDLLLDFMPSNPEQEVLISNLKLNKERLRSIFSDIVSNFENIPPINDDIVDMTMIRISWSRIEVQTQAIAFDASLLNRMLEKKMNRLQHQRVILLFILIGLFSAFLVINFITVNRRILKAISVLQTGIGIIGSGNLDFRLIEKRVDEIGDLSHAFNRMTADLKMVTASKAHLEREIIERKRAEDALRNSEEQLRASLREKEVLIKEIHHRVKNNMQIISSLVSLKAKELKNGSMSDLLENVTHRVRSMALVHEKLYQSPDLARIEFDKYMKSLLTYLWHAHGKTSAVQLSLDLKPVSLSVNSAVPCGLIINELAVNAFKYAFCGCDNGELVVSLHEDAQGLVSICICDNGPGMPNDFDWSRTSTFGLRLVRMLAGQLNADVEFSSNSGTEFKITFKEMEK